VRGDGAREPRIIISALLRRRPGRRVRRAASFFSPTCRAPWVTLPPTAASAQASARPKTHLGLLLVRGVGGGRGVEVVRVEDEVALLVVVGGAIVPKRREHDVGQLAGP
jgi:hypothetical protein